MSNSSPKMCRALFINPYKAEVTEVQLPLDEPEPIQQLLDCRCFTTAGRIGDDVLFVDDEGLFGATHFFRIPGVNGGQPLAGKGVVIGDDGEGGSADTVTQLDQLRDSVRWVYAMDNNGDVLFDVKASARGQAARTEVVVL